MIPAHERSGRQARGHTARRSLLVVGLVCALPPSAGADPFPGMKDPAPLSRPIESKGNPIIADGSYYTADSAPLVAGDTLYLIAGRDEAPPDVNDFIMNEWELLATQNVVAGHWTHYPNFLRPETLFSWAAPGRAYAAQIVQGTDKRFYLYAPVIEAANPEQDRFGVGVAVADSPLGPWKDAHPSGPIASQRSPEPNRIQNIDPTVYVDDDGRVFMYWGTFGQLRGAELAPDMVTVRGPVVRVTGLTGFFEAPWLFKRRGTYYLVYADNQAGPASPCTPAVYHACIAYGTATSPLGPWTYRGVILPPVSSTTSHPGVIEFKGQWYLTYHTAGAAGGGHFRRSVALDRLEWDDSTSPARILPVKLTSAVTPVGGSPRNLARLAVASASNDPVPVQYWIKALNDGIVRKNPLPPDMWGSWSPHNPPQQWIEYHWDKPVTVSLSRIYFWADHPAGSGEGVAPPKSWKLQFCQGDHWQSVKHPSAYGTGVDRFEETRFDPVTTRCLRAVFDASTDGSRFAGVAVQEWEVQ